MSEATTWEVFGLRLGSVDREAADNFVDPRGRTGAMRLDFIMWVVVSDRGVVVFDTGFHPEAGRRRGRVLERQPREAVRLVGVDPDSVTTVALSHLHYDHAGNLADFPNAEILVQADELAYVVGSQMQDERSRHFFEADDIAASVRLLHAGRLRVVEGDVLVAPGLELHLIGGHTPGLQVMRVFTQRGWIVLAADAAHYRANLEERNPFPAVHDAKRLIAGYGELERLAGDATRIVPGHDPEVFELYGRADLPDGVAAVHQPLGTPRTEN